MLTRQIVIILTFECVYFDNILLVGTLCFTVSLRTFSCAIMHKRALLRKSLTFAVIHCVQKKHPLTFSFISLWIMCRFKQKLQWTYLRNGRFWKYWNYIFIVADDVIMTSHL